MIALNALNLTEWSETHTEINLCVSVGIGIFKESQCESIDCLDMTAG